jgi:hypothetical protein
MVKCISATDECAYEGTAVCILNLSTRWKQAVSLCCLSALTPGEKIPCSHMSGPKICSDCGGRDNYAVSTGKQNIGSATS